MIVNVFVAHGMVMMSTNITEYQYYDLLSRNKELEVENARLRKALEEIANMAFDDLPIRLRAEDALE